MRCWSKVSRCTEVAATIAPKSMFESRSRHERMASGKEDEPESSQRQAARNEAKATNTACLLQNKK